MSLTAKLRRAPLRIATGAYILNSGVGKVSTDDGTAKYLHSAAVRTFPQLEKLDPKVFAKILAAAEISLGSALLLPIVPVGVAGAGLAVFSGSLLTMYWKSEDLHLPNDPRPTLEGSAIAKDVWMAGIATSLIIDGLTAPAHDKAVEVSATVAEKAATRKRQSRKARRQAKQERKQTIAHAKEMAAQAKEAAKVAAAQAKSQAKGPAKDAAKAARKQAEAAAKAARSQAKDLSSQAKDVAAAARSHSKDLSAQAREAAEQAKAAARDASAKTSVRARDLADAAKTAAKTATKAA
ncbi:MAG: hypothetical protein ACTHMS_03370 [Jatrophihabitans sp.]|uniref:hypothetical protein n=1 Tax=Jatrophihabitans sp. TaxID=1932789 RepID=UPI003F7EDE41